MALSDAAGSDQQHGTRDDRILPETRVALMVVVPFPVLASVILYFFVERAGERFASAIKLPMVA